MEPCGTSKQWRLFTLVMLSFVSMCLEDCLLIIKITQRNFTILTNPFALTVQITQPLLLKERTPEETEKKIILLALGHPTV